MAASLEGAAAVVTPEGKILSVNEILASWMNSTAAMSVGQDLPALLGAESEARGTALRALLLSSKEFDWAELPGCEETATPRLGVELCRVDAVRFLYFESALLAAPLPRPTAGAAFKQRPDLSFSHAEPRLEGWTGIALYDWHHQPGLFPNAIECGGGLTARLENVKQTAPLLTSTFQFRHTLTGRLTRIREHRRVIWDAGGTVAGYEGYWVDVTAQSTALERLLQSAWRESVGTLMMTSLHDFCNIATAVVGLAQSAKADSEPESPLRAGLESIRTAAFGASQVAHRLQRWHMRTHGEKTFADLNESVRNLSDILRKVLPRRIGLQTNLQEGQLPIEVDPLGLEQALVVFALNAADAMPAGGQITLSTRSHEVPPNACHLHGALPRPPLVALSVTDTGLGMSASALGRVFEPFFSTKPQGKGAGLGLYRVRLFAEKHGAALSIDTQAGAGTTFHLWFARADLDAPQPGETEQETPRPILLVTGAGRGDHEEVAGRLRAGGYYAVSIGEEKAAIEALCAPGYDFAGALVLAGDGFENTVRFCRELRAQNHQVRILIGLVAAEQTLPPSRGTAEDWSLVTVHAADFIEQVEQIMGPR